MGNSWKGSGTAGGPGRLFLHGQATGWMLKALLLLLVVLGISGAAGAQNRAGIGLGQWQPNSLAEERPASVFSGTADSSPFIQLQADLKLFPDVALHVSLGHWAHRFHKSDEPSTITMLPIEIGLKHILVSQTAINPYAVYGAGLLLASYGRSLHKSSLPNLSNFSTGFDIFLTTGIQVTPFQPLGLDLNFGYIVAVLPKKLGVGDYSGLRATVGLFFIF